MSKTKLTRFVARGLCASQCRPYHEITITLIAYNSGFLMINSEEKTVLCQNTNLINSLEKCHQNDQNRKSIQFREKKKLIFQF